MWPPAFMDTARRILTSLGISEHRIKEESFGEKIAVPIPSAVQATVRVEFAISKKVCHVPVESNLLEVAEGNGVPLPFGCNDAKTLTRCDISVTEVLQTIPASREYSLESAVLRIHESMAALSCDAVVFVPHWQCAWWASLPLPCTVAAELQSHTKVHHSN